MRISEMDNNQQGKRDDGQGYRMCSEGFNTVLS